MEQAAYAEWLDNRDEHHRRLFGEFTVAAALAPATEIDLHSAPLTDITRQVDLRGRNSKSEQIAVEELVDAVSAILDCHNDQGGTNDAIFCITQDEHTPVLQGLTATILVSWERACLRKNIPSPFADLPVSDIVPSDFARPDVQQVVETANAVIGFLESGYPFGEPDSTANSTLGRFIARYGPEYARAWIRGDIIRGYCENIGEQPEQWLTVIPEYQRYALIRNYDPLQVVRKIITAFNNELSTERLVSTLQWPSKKVDSLLTITRRLRIARHPNPVLRVQEIAEQFDTTYSIGELAKMSGWSTSRTKAVYTDAFRIDNIVGRASPLMAFKRIARNVDLVSDTAALAEATGLKEVEILTIFPESSLFNLARKRADPIAAIKRIARHMPQVTTEHLCSVLEWKPAVVEAVFPASVRYQLACAKNPVKAAKAIADTGRLLILDHDLPPKLAYRIASNYANSAVVVADRIRDELPNKPAGVSKEMWMWTVSRCLNGTTQERLESIARHRLYLSVVNPRSSSVDIGDGGGLTLEGTFADTTTGPEEALTDSDPGEFLEAIAARAGVPAEQVAQLLEHFKDHDASDIISAELARALQNLRNTAA